MREPQRRSLARLSIALILCLFLGLDLPGGRQATHAAAGSVSFTVINGRTGLLHVTATGLPPGTPVSLELVTQTLANPGLVLEYFMQYTSADGTLDVDDPTGVFICGTNVQLLVAEPDISQPPPLAVLVNGIQPFGVIYAVSPTVLAQCPATHPVVGIAGVLNGAVQVSGQGFNVKETVAISVTSTLSGAINTITLQSDYNGNLTAAVPLGSISCPDTLTPSATGSAGSVAIGAPFAYVCSAPPPSPIPTVTSTVTAVPPTATPIPGSHLTVMSGPPRIGPHQLETVRVATALRYVVLRVVFSAAGLPSVAFSVRTDNEGNAHFSYMAPSHVPPGEHVVRFTVSFRAGSHVLQQTGSFIVLGS